MMNIFSVFRSLDPFRHWAGGPSDAAWNNGGGLPGLAILSFVIVTYEYVHSNDELSMHQTTE